MPTFIVAGFQRNLSPRITRALTTAAPLFQGWTAVPFVGHLHNQHDIGRAQVEELLELAKAHNGAHIFGVSVLNTRDAIEELIRPYFRFRWLDARPFGRVGAGNDADLIASLRNALTEEDYWIENVKPKDPGSPLTLPDIFGCQRELRDIWRLSQSYNNRGHLEAATKRIARFVSYHRRRVEGFGKTPWCADDDWIWDDDGERHGIPCFPMDWKYSLHLPDGFHFDVSAKAKGKTHFKDRSGKLHVYKKHVNVTAHGDVRGASASV